MSKCRCSRARSAPGGSRAHFQQAGDAPLHPHMAAAGGGDAAQNFQTCVEPVETSVLLPAPLRPMPVLSLSKGCPRLRPVSPRRRRRARPQGIGDWRLGTADCGRLPDFERRVRLAAQLRPPAVDVVAQGIAADDAQTVVFG